MENKNKKLNLDCLVCKSKSVNLFANKNSHDLYRCSDCGLIFVNPLPEIVLSIYNWDYFNGATAGFGYVDYDNDKRAMQSTFEKYLNMIENLLPERGKLLDIGAATGYFVKLAQNKGWSVTGIELSEWAANKGRTEGLDIFTGSLESVDFPRSYFDAVTLIDVLEHLTDPRHQLKIIAEMLKPGGVVAINTPDTGSLFARLFGRRWHLLIPPEHLFLFNKKNLSRLLKESGFEMIDVRKIGKNFTLQYAAHILANWQGRSLLHKISGLFRSSRWGKIGIPINLRDNFFILARRLK